MIYDLICPQNHTFEGWFHSPESFDGQLQHNLIQCPHCGLSKVHKKPSGGHIASSHKTATPQEAKSQTPTPETIPADPILMLKQIQHHIQKHFKDVGDTFCDTAIAMHEGKTKPENIVGKLTPEQKELLDEKGVSYAGIPKLGPSFEN